MKFNRKCFRKHPPGRSKGNALVELALIMPLILLITIGLIEFSHAYMQLNNLNKSIRDGIAYLSRIAVSVTGNTVIDFTNDPTAPQMIADTEDLIQDNFHATALASVSLEDDDIDFASEGDDHIRITVVYCHPLLLGDLLSSVSGFFGAELNFSNCAAGSEIPFNVTGTYRVL